MPEDLNIAKNRKIVPRLLIDTPEGLFDVTDYLIDLEIERGDTSRIGTGQSGTDNTVATMSFTLVNGGEQIPFYDSETEEDKETEYDKEKEFDKDAPATELINFLFDTQERYDRDTFSPRDEFSDFNQWNNEYNPLLFPNVEVIYQLAIIDDPADFGDDPADEDYTTMFQGFLGDDIRVSAHEVSCELRDLAKPMQDKLVEELQEYGDTDNPPTAEEVIREIMDENGFEDYPFDPDEDSDGSEFSIPEYQVEYVSVWQAIQEIAAERGWFLGFRWDTDEDEYRLKFLEPDRGMDVDDADYEIDWSTDFYDDEYNLSDKDIRNACKVIYRNRDSGEIEEVIAEDQNSIDTYDRKFMQFEEEDTSLIDTEDEAEQLAEAAVKDLRELPAGQDVTLPICPELDVLMGVNINDPRLSSTKDFVGIESVRHSFGFGDNPSYETTIIGSGYVSGGHKKWIDRDARSGVKKPIDVDTVKNQIVGNSITVAAHNSSLRGRRGADYVCKGESDQVTINKAIDSVERGGAVVLLEGEYIVDDEIQIKTEIDLRGQGNSTILKNSVIANDYRLFNLTNTNPENIKLYNFLIDGNNSNNDNTFQILDTSDVSDFIFNDIKVIDVGNANIIHFKDSSNINIINNTVNSGSYRIFNLTSCTDVSIKDNTIRNSSAAGVLIDNCENCSVRNNTIYETQNGINVVNGSTRNNITNNLIHNNKRDSIRIRDSHNNNIDNNYIHSSGTEVDTTYSGIWLFDSDENKVTNNKIRSGDENNQPAYGISIDNSGCENNYVTNNDLFNSGELGNLNDNGTETVTSAGNRT